MSNWVQLMIRDKFLICDKEWVDNCTDIYMSNFVKKCNHLFVDSSTTETDIEKCLKDNSNKSIILWNLSSEMSSFVKKHIEYRVFDCGKDQNIFSIEMSLMPIEIFIKLNKLCKIVTDLLHKYNIVYFATGGTKIGILRNKNLLPWDWDIDFIIPDIKSNVLSEDFKNDLKAHNITIFDGKPLKKDFKLKIGDLNIYLDMICQAIENKVVKERNIQKYPCNFYEVAIDNDSVVAWDEWQEYIESAYFYCHIVFIIMGQAKYSKEGVKIYEDYTHKNKFKIADYANYLNQVFARYNYDSTLLNY